MGIIYEKKDKIAYVTLNRPEAMNALDPETDQELEKAWKDIAEDQNVWVAILTGAGDKAFCAGADLKKLIPLRKEWARKAELKPSSYMTLKGVEVWKPIIAAVNGHCLAGGMEMLLGTDIRIAAEHATFGLPEPRWGLMTGGGSTVRLPRQISYCRAMEILLTGDRITAQEAYEIGLVNKVVPYSELMPTAQKMAERICENGPFAVQRIKESVVRSLHLDFVLEQLYFHRVLLSEDAEEGPRSFMEKRKPVYKGQ